MREPPPQGLLRRTAACRALLAGLVLAAAVPGPSCAGSRANVPGAEAAAPSPVRLPRPFQSGERLVYRARVAGVDAARATLAVGAPRKRNGRAVLPLRAALEGYAWLAQIYPLKIKLITEVDPDTLRPVRMRREGANGNVARTVELVFQGKGRVSVSMAEAGGRPRVFQRVTFPDAFDTVSGLYEIRAWLLSGEQQRDLPAFDGAWNRRVRVNKGPLEDVWTPAGSFLARRFEVEAERVQVPGDRSQPRWEPRVERFTAWVTEDDQLVPVKLLGETPVGPAEVLLESRTHRAPGE